MVVVFVLTVIGGIGLLGLAMFPGLLEDTVFGLPFFCLSLPLLGFWFLLLIGLALGDLARKSNLANKPQPWGLLSAAIMFVTIPLLWFHVPQRLVFKLFHNELQEMVDAIPPGEFPQIKIEKQIGPYWIDWYGSDRRGGVYFRTHIGPDGIGPDQMSYGFAFQPNQKGTPFGNAHYHRWHLFGDWYMFSASNDW